MVKKWQKICCVAIIAVFSFIFLNAAAEDCMAAVNLSASSRTLIVGEKYTIKVSGATSCSFKSSDSNIIKVTPAGKCTAKAPGNATVTVTAGSVKKTCKFKVNRTFGISTDSVSISANKTIRLTLTGSGAVKSARANSKICRLKFGKWSGDNVSVTIIPLKAGSTRVTFSNTANTETCVLKVKVTAVPVTATLDEPVISTGARDFVVNENDVSFPVTLDRRAKETIFAIYDGRGNKLKSLELGTVAANKTTYVNWDGNDADGTPYEGTYTYSVIADGYTTQKGDYYKIWQRSPFVNGDGSEKSPYRVSGAEEFKKMPEHDDEGVYFVLDSDIDFDGESVGEMFYQNPLKGSLSGTFDGIRHRLNGVLGAPKVDSSSKDVLESGTILGNISQTGVVRDMDIVEAKITGTGAVLATKNYGVIQDINLSATLLCNQSDTKAGMFAEENYGQIKNCRAEGSMYVSIVNVVSGVKLKAGSVAGLNSGRIHECSSSCVITGNLQVSSSVAVDNSYGLYIGGIAGDNTNVGIVSVCIFMGNITAHSTGDVDYIGGICGNNDGITDACTFNYIGIVSKSQGSGNGV